MLRPTQLGRLQTKSAHACVFAGRASPANCFLKFSTPNTHTTLFLLFSSLSSMLLVTLALCRCRLSNVRERILSLVLSLAHRNRQTEGERRREVCTLEASGIISCNSVRSTLFAAAVAVAGEMRARTQPAANRLRLRCLSCVCVVCFCV